MNYRLGKKYKLCSKVTIDTIFDSGHTVKSFPFIAKLKVVELSDGIPFKIVISAPKKTFRHAHERNRIKRICREAVRLNKTILESYLISENKQLALFLLYTSKEELNHEQLKNSAFKLFNKIITKLDEHKN